MSERVEYDIRFTESGLASVAANSDKAASGLSKVANSTGGLNMSLGSLLKTAGIVTLAFKAFNFLSESVEDFNAAEQASAQLNATLESTQYSAGLSRAALDQQAIALSKVTKFDDDAIASMQSLLLTFTDIKGAVFQEATPAILDLAEKMGGDLKGASIQVGKALNDPIKGVTALSKVGVSFTETQKLMIKKLVETGDTAAAQRIILAELNKEFGGSAEAAAQAGTGGLTVIANRFGNIKESIGGLIVDGLEKLYPILNSILDVVEGAPAFFEKWNAEIEAMGVFIGLLAVGFGTYTLVVEGAAIMTSAWELAQWGLNAAMTANPIGVIIVGIAALAAGIYYAWEQCETFRATLYGIWEVAKVLVDTFFTLAKAWYVPTPGNIEDAYNSLMSVGENVDKAYTKGKAEGMADFAESKQKREAEEAEKAKKEEEKLNRYKIKPSGVGGGTGVKFAKTSSMAQASKPVQINVSIQSLVNNLNVSKEFKEAPQTIAKEITKALIASVNDFQRVAGA